MGFLQKLLGRETGPAAIEKETIPCPHTTLIPRWESAEDMGDETKASAFTCQACRRSFTGEEGRALRRTEAERVTEMLATEEKKEA